MFHLFCKKNESDCSHSDEERQWVDTYTIDEIVYAVELGYKIKVLEIMSFEKFGPILKDYMLFLSYFKLKYSGVPCNVETAQQHCVQIMEKNDFSSIGLLLQPSNLKQDLCKKSIFKMIVNSAVGKFSLNEDKIIETKLVQSYEELLKSHQSGFLTDFECLSDETCQIGLKNPKIGEFKRNCNIVIGSHITAFGRVLMHKNAMHLVHHGATLHMIANDALFFSMEREKKPTEILDVGPAPGQFSFIYDGKILAFSALGTKSYSLLYQDLENLYFISLLKYFETLPYGYNK
jgi:hypothetical protein